MAAKDDSSKLGETDGDWRGVVAERVTHSMLWAVLGAVVLFVVAAVVDALFLGGCIDVPGYTSRGCENDPPTPSASVVPKGAVVAVWHDRIVDRAEQCPKEEGWFPFDEGRGRFLIGAGEPTMKEYNEWKPEKNSEPEKLSTYNPKDIGGKEWIKMMPEQLPSHTHNLGIVGLNGVSAENAGEGAMDILWFSDPITNFTTDNANEDERMATFENLGEDGNALLQKNLQNLPPYIALYFCKYVGLEKK